MVICVQAFAKSHFPNIIEIIQVVLKQEYIYHDVEIQTFHQIQSIFEKLLENIKQREAKRKLGY